LSEASISQNDEPSNGRRAVTSRIFQLLDAFREVEGSLTIPELVRRTGLPRSTVHRMVGDLVDLGALERTGSGAVTLGLRLFELGSLVGRHRRLRDAAFPYLEDLHISTGQVVHLGVLDGDDVVYLLRITGHRGMVLPSRDGARMPAHATGLGKAMLAFAESTEVDQIIRRRAPLTQFTLVVPELFKAELAEIRRTGVAFDREEAMPGVTCVAAPIFLSDPRALASLSVTGPAQRFDPTNCAKAVRAAADAITRAVGGRRKSA
jgi:IclR family acetate operon transcriptional repressor